MIALVGNVFSPFYYAKRQTNALVNPLDYCAFNVALYTPKKRYWAFTEWPQDAVQRSPDRLIIGTNQWHWTADGLTVKIDEKMVRKKRPLSGELRLVPAHHFDLRYSLDPAGHHSWWPLAPLAKVEARFTDPALSFSGSAYIDANAGDEPLEARMRGWTWSHHSAGNSALVFYDTEDQNSHKTPIALRFSNSGGVEPVDAWPLVKLPRTFAWSHPREMRSDPQARPRVIKTLEESPFYARSIVESDLDHTPSLGMHESLSVAKFDTWWMQRMLPFRIWKRP